MLFIWKIERLICCQVIFKLAEFQSYSTSIAYRAACSCSTSRIRLCGLQHMLAMVISESESAYCQEHTQTTGFLGLAVDTNSMMLTWIWYAINIWSQNQCLSDMILVDRNLLSTWGSVIGIFHSCDMLKAGLVCVISRWVQIKYMVTCVNYAFLYKGAGKFPDTYVIQFYNAWTPVLWAA